MDQGQVIQSFNNEKVVTITLLATWLSCSVTTARRRLGTWKSYTSYNHNGRYYTLPEIAEFDDNGLWWHQGVFFSKHGNLKQTLIYLVSHSERGLSGSELGVLLGLQPRSFLSHFRDHPELHREHVEGRWIWYSGDRETYEKQRQMHSATTKKARMPSDMEAVMILVDLIQYPNSGLAQIAERLKLKGLNIDVDTIRQLLAHHDLLKKTVDSPASDV